MRRLALLLSIATLSPAAALAAALSVGIDHAERVTVSRPVKDVMVGNPMIADVAILDSHHLLITGRAYGVTNLLVTDANGRPVISREVVVSAVDANRVSVYRGPDVYNYACNAKCERTPMPGERTGGVYDQWSTPYTDYAGRARSGEQNGGQAQP